MGAATACLSRCAISIYVGALMFELITVPLAMLYITRLPAALYIILQVVLLVLPLEPRPQWALQLLEFSMNSYGEWCRLKLVYEHGAEETFSAVKPCVIGYEPHSVLPFGLPLVFSDAAPFRANIGQVCTLATSMVDWCPIIRHLFYWLGGRPASRRNMHKFLSQGCSIAVIPGGVAECAYMRDNEDVVFLKPRKGFIKIALQHGAPLVPVFCFGQNYVYKCIRMGPPLVPRWIVDRFVRRLLLCPMLIFGKLGSPLPFRTKLYMVIGKPISVPKVDEPSAEEVEQYLEMFIAGMQQMYERHKAEAGYANSKMIVM